MKTYLRYLVRFALAGLLLLTVLAAGTRSLAAFAYPETLTLEQTAAIHSAELLLLYGNFTYEVYLPIVRR
jgi:hypothetical protein